MTYYLSREELAEVSEAATGFSIAVRDEGLLSSALARPQASFDGIDVYPDLWHKAAALIESLARNHGLVDGNKRTAWLSGLFFLEANDIDTGAPDADSAESFVLQVATGNFGDDIPKMAVALRQVCDH